MTHFTIPDDVEDINCARCFDDLPGDFYQALRAPDTLGIARHPSGAFVTGAGAVYCAECAPDVVFCRGCGCTDEAGCDEGCYWVEDDLCSACAKRGKA